MKTLSQFSEIFTKFEISHERGFLPNYTPLLSLGREYEAWDHAVAHLPELIADKRMQSTLASLPEFSLSNLKTAPEKERAFLILSHVAHAYLWETGEMRKVLPAKIAIPFVELADEFGRPAVVHHASNVMYNWRKLDSTGELVAENMEALVGFDGSKDEAWFYNITAEIEAVGAPALKEMIQLRMADENLEEALLIESLTILNQALQRMIHSLEKMTLHCSPNRFYHKIRPFLASLVDLEYEGVEHKPVRTYAGGSAAQSSLIQAFDIVLGIQHPHGSGKYLLAMRDHMPPAHKAFLEWLEDGMNVKALVSGKKEAEKLFTELGQSLLHFRNTHLKIVAMYIAKPAREAGLSSQGTGGTDALTFLKEVRNDMKEIDS